MAKIYFTEHISRIAGRICKKDPNGITYLTRKDSGTRYVQHRHYDASHPATAEQVAAREKFKAAWAAVKTVMADPVQLSTYIEAFKAQRKYPTLRGFVFAQEYAKL